MKQIYKGLNWSNSAEPFQLQNTPQDPTASQFHLFLKPVSSSECEKARHTARFPTILRMFPTSKHYLVPKSIVLKLRNPGLNPQVFLLAFLDKPLAQSKSQNFRVKYKPTFI